MHGTDGIRCSKTAEQQKHTTHIHTTGVNAGNGSGIMLAGSSPESKQHVVSA